MHVTVPSRSTLPVVDEPKLQPLLLKPTLQLLRF